MYTKMIIYMVAPPQLEPGKLVNKPLNYLQVVYHNWYPSHVHQRIANVWGPTLQQ